jgi:hypothetical protein
VSALAIGASTAAATPARPAAAVDCVEVGHQAGDVKMVTLYDGTGYSGACIEFERYCDVRLWDALNCPSGGAATPWIDISSDLRFTTNWSNRASCIRVS